MGKSIIHFKLFLFFCHDKQKQISKFCVTGVLSGGHIGPRQLLQQRLRCGQIREALGILDAMDWSIMGDECFQGLSVVVNHLLRLELNAEREGEWKRNLAGLIKHQYFFFF